MPDPSPPETVVDLFTDGACSGNPGPGGWGVLMRCGDVEKELTGGERRTTNNRMELRAAIEGLNALKRGVRVRLHTDSQYVKNGITQWIHAWKARGWRTADKQPVKNIDLWQALDEACQRHDIEWIWVRGHHGHEGNERADGLARRGMAEVLTSSTERTETQRTEIATFGAGCFWCVEAVLEQLGGVLDVTSGYMGGTVEAPTYRQVCTGSTGHAEVVQVTFDPTRISYQKLLDWFWKLHDPTTVDRQGNDVGTQYRSVIFYHDEAQREAAERSKREIDASGTFERPVVTQIAPAGRLWVAEDYHQDYYRHNRQQPYCRAVIVPKLDKLGLEQ